VACVATFDSYEDETGTNVRYLAKLESFGPKGKNGKGSSLAPFFDEVNDPIDEKEDNLNVVIPGIAAFAIGCGIELEQDISQIESFIDIFSNSMDVSARPALHTIQPNDGCSSMSEENLIYKQLTIEEKANTVHIGPTKMARFVFSIANDIVSEAFQEDKDISEEETLPENNSNRDKEDNIEDCKDDAVEVAKEGEEFASTLVEYDQNITRYACKICRTILFSENDLEDPPHIKSKHSFSQRKIKSSAATSCQSLFLAHELNWMGDIGSSNEGKLSCPKCKAKVGLWNWAGTQCSCGTWVVPAIQIPLGRVDPVLPENEMKNRITSPLAHLHIGGSGI
jgi:dual specificity phosphatase 12